MELLPKGAQVCLGKLFFDCGGLHASD
jgi:hypothetical protein